MPPETTTDRELRGCSADTELRATTTDGKTKLEGYAAVYNVRSLPMGGKWFRHYEIIRPGAFARALRGSDDVRALHGHDPDKLLGRTTSGTLRLSEDTRGLKYSIDMPEAQYSKDLIESVRRRDLTQSSFGFRAIKDNWIEEKSADNTIVEVRELLEVELFDISPVTYAQYDATEVAVRSLEAFRRLRGVSPAMAAARLRLAEAS